MSPLTEPLSRPALPQVEGAGDFSIREYKQVAGAITETGTSHGIACYLPIRVDLLWIAMTINGGTYTKEIKRMTPAPQMMSKKAAPIPTRSVAANGTRRLARGRRYRGLDFHSGI